MLLGYEGQFIGVGQISRLDTDSRGKETNFKMGQRGISLDTFDPISVISKATVDNVPLEVSCQITCTVVGSKEWSDEGQ